MTISWRISWVGRDYDVIITSTAILTRLTDVCTRLSHWLCIMHVFNLYTVLRICWLHCLLAKRYYMDLLMILNTILILHTFRLLQDILFVLHLFVISQSIIAILYTFFICLSKLSKINIVTVSKFLCLLINKLRLLNFNLVSLFIFIL